MSGLSKQDIFDNDLSCSSLKDWHRLSPAKFAAFKEEQSSRSKSIDDTLPITNTSLPSTFNLLILSTIKINFDLNDLVLNKLNNKESSSERSGENPLTSSLRHSIESSKLSNVNLDFSEINDKLKMDLSLDRKLTNDNLNYQPNNNSDTKVQFSHKDTFQTEPRIKPVLSKIRLLSTSEEE